MFVLRDRRIYCQSRNNLFFTAKRTVVYTVFLLINIDIFLKSLSCLKCVLNPYENGLRIDRSYLNTYGLAKLTDF